LHQFIEEQGNHDKPEEIMVLMLGFCTGLIIQLRNKVETLEDGLGDRFLDFLNKTIINNSEGLKIIEKLGTNDPLVNRSSSEISPNDLPAAIEFLENNIRNNIKIQLDALPFALRTELTLFHALAIVLANLFNGLDSKNVNSMIDNFAENVRNFARETAKENKPNYH
jgi:hypothetical protein